MWYPHDVKQPDPHHARREDEYSKSTFAKSAFSPITLCDVTAAQALLALSKIA